MKYEYNEAILDYMKEQVWEAKTDIDVYGELSEFEYDQIEDHLPPEAPRRSFEIGSGLGRGSIHLNHIYGLPATNWILADRHGRTENKGQFFPSKDEYYNDFDLTREFCTLNGLWNFDLFDTEKDDWNSFTEKFDFIHSRCAIGFHVPLERYLDRLIDISTPDVTMIFGMNNHYVHSDKFDSRFQEVVFLPGIHDPKFPWQRWLIFKGLK